MVGAVARALGWRRAWLPTPPPVPPRLWATLAAAALAGLHWGFHAEIWSGPPDTWPDRLAVGGLLGAAWVQAVGVGWRWMAPAASPWWWRLGWLLALRAAAVGSLLLAAIILLLIVN